MFRNFRALVILSGVLAFAGCGKSSTDKCKDVKCATGMTCNATTGKCQTGVTCKVDVDCPSSVAHCLSATCVACVDDTHCGGTRKCDTASHICKQTGTACSIDSTCSAPTPYCSPSDSVCVGCYADTQCTNQVCDLGTSICVSCTTNANCSGSTPVCEPTSKTCVQCATTNDCTGGATCNTTSHRCQLSCTTSANCTDPLSPVCDTGSGLCVQCLVASSCPGLTDICLANNTCGPKPTPPANDTCAAPTSLTLNNGAATVSGDTTTATNDTSSGSCGGSGPDVVYLVSLTGGSHLVADLTTTGTYTDPVIYIRPAGAGCDTASDILCAGTVAPATNHATLDLSYLPTGDYVIFVDGYAGSHGPFTLTVTATSVPPPLPGESCFVPGTLTFDPTTKVANISGDTTGKSNKGSGACSTATGTRGDLVYELTLSQPQGVDVVVTPTGSSDPVIYVAGSCPGSAGTGGPCANAAGPGAAETLHVDFLPIGKYFIYVDEAGATGGAFTGTVTLVPPPPPPTNETCATAATIVLGGTATGNTSMGVNDYDPTATGCTGYDAASPDVVYSFTPTASGKVIIELTGAPNFDTSLYVLPAACTVSACIAGSDLAGKGGTEKLTLDVIANTAYMIVVDGYSSASGTNYGAYTLSVKAPPPPPANDTCANATVISVAQTLTGDTTSAIDDYQSPTTGCAGTAAASPDVVYSFTPAIAGRYFISLTGEPAFDTVLYVLPAACTTTACIVGADKAANGGTEKVTLDALAATTYMIVVDGFSTSTGKTSYGTYSLAVDLAPTNDVCTSATLLSLSPGPATGTATVTGDTTLATPDTSSTACGGSGPDLVYQVHLTNASNHVTATVTPTNATYTDPVVYIRQAGPSCATNPELAGTSCNQATGGAAATVDLTNVPLGDYDVFVDGYLGSKGPFTLTVTVQ